LQQCKFLQRRPGQEERGRREEGEMEKNKINLERETEMGRGRFHKWEGARERGVDRKWKGMRNRGERKMRRVKWERGTDGTGYR